MKRSIRCLLLPVVCLMVCLSAEMAGLCVTTVVSADVPSAGWVERRPAGDVNRQWYGLASDAAGTRLVAAAFGNYGNEGWVYTSADGGASWTIRYPIATSQYWRAVACDADGSNLIVAAWAGRLYTSSNSGVGWTERQPVGAIDQRWQTVASNSDGSVLLAGASAGRLWVSQNGGTTWAETRPAGDVQGDWRGASSNSDGSVLLVGNYEGRLYVSLDSGTSWTELTPAGAADRGWQGTACDEDGSNLIVGVEGGRLYTSSNSGSSWTERRPVGDTNRNWSRFASNYDGSVLLAADQARLFLSLDGGATWAEQRPAGDKDVHWTCCSNADGSCFAVGNYSSGRLYTLGVNPVVRTLTVDSVGNGTVTLDPAGGTYDDGTVVTLTANPAPGYTFTGWSGDLSGTTNPTTIAMTGNKTVTATFAAGAASMNLSLLPSWNVISVPFPTPVSLLPTCDLFLAWDGSLWQPAATLLPGIGYLVRNTIGATTVTLSGTPSSSPQTQPATGTWQIIGNPYTTPASFTCTSTVPYLLFWDGSLWQSASLTNLPPGLGFLLQASSPGTITLTRLP